MKIFFTLWCCFSLCTLFVKALPTRLLYDYRNAIQLPKNDDVSSNEIKLAVPIVFYGQPFNTIFVNSNGLLSFQTEIPDFFNIEFPLDYPVIAPLYTNVDISRTGTISYYETTNEAMLYRAKANIHESFSYSDEFEPKSLFIATWSDVGYHENGTDSLNTFQVAIASDGEDSYVEFLYPESGIQWIQGTGDDSGLPDARAQAGFVAVDGRYFTLQGSGTDQVKNLIRWSNMNLPGQWIFRIGQIEPNGNIEEPDLNNDADNDIPRSCAKGSTQCHSNAKCVDYESGFCCSCTQQYYGNGKYCVKKDIPLRVNGKVTGKINGEKLENLDLQSYVVTVDGRAYTAISKIPESIGGDIQSLKILGGVIGWLFAKPLGDALNGYQLTGGVFNHTATIRFTNTAQTVAIRHKYIGLDVFDQLRLDVDIQGDIPILPVNSKIAASDYEQQLTLTAPGVIQSSSSHLFTYTTPEGAETIIPFTIDQSFIFDYCLFETIPVGVTWRLKVGKIYIGYEAREQIIRYGMSNKIGPLGDIDPCEQGRATCGSNSACVVENDSFRCVCNPGYQYLYNGTQATCHDIDECQSGTHDCDFNAQCINDIGSYSCKCNAGFEGNGRVCENAVSCANVQCGPNAECVENGIAMCRCISGFSGNGQLCSPIVDRSCHLANNCSPYAVCTINAETRNYACVCLPGYDGDGYDCKPPAETTEGGGGNCWHCSRYATCTVDPTAQSYECVCNSGYEGDGFNCNPQEESTESESCHLANNCSPFAVCTVSSETRSYVCICIPGYDGDGYDCKPEIPTTETIDAPVSVQCILGACWCPIGYDRKEGTDYCIPRQDRFPTTDLAENETISYSTVETTIDTSTEPDQVSCNIINDCHPQAQCLYEETLNSYQCSCNAGFEGDGYYCRPEEISCAQVNNCDPHATCTYNVTIGKSVCVCNAGYAGDGKTCQIVAICYSNDDCQLNEICTAANECICKPGLVRDTQSHCVSLSGTCGGGRCVENAECLYDDEYQTYYCACKKDFIGDGITECKPRPVGCNVLNNCGLHANCEYDYQQGIYHCKCNEGFFGDGFLCYAERNCHVDPTLCDSNAHCVTNADRKYVCECKSGYTGNGAICKKIPQHDGNFLLLNQGMATLRIPFEPSKTNVGRPIQIKYFQIAVGLDIDCFAGRIYWSDIGGRAIRSSLYNGTEPFDLVTKDIGSPEGLSFDWISRNIYWTDSTRDTIEVANVETKLRKTLITSDLVNPRGIAVHPQKGKIFWTDWDRKGPKIEWANSDGSDREIFLKGDAVKLPNSLVIDFDSDELCYADAGTKNIECINIDSKVRQTVAVNCTYPFGVAITDQHIYWSDWISKKIERMDKKTLKRLPPLDVPLGGSGNKLYGLVAVPNHCPNLASVCQFYSDQCPSGHICLPNGYGSRNCACASKIDSPLETTCI